jgi:Na+/H+ antiporter NhaD/arsenite permease-like protein
VSSVGIIVLTQMEDAGLAGYELNVFLANFVAHVLVAVAAYLLFGGRKLVQAGKSAEPEAAAEPFTLIHQLTTLVLALWIVAVVFFDVDPGVSAFAAAALLIIARCCTDRDAVASVPWDAILMVSGVSVLIGVMDETGGLERFTNILARIATPDSVNGVMAFVTGVISTYSSTSGVVYPAFLPLGPGSSRRSAAAIRWRCRSASTWARRSWTSRRCRRSARWRSRPCRRMREIRRCCSDGC